MIQILVDSKFYQAHSYLFRPVPLKFKNVQFGRLKKPLIDCELYANLKKESIMIQILYNLNIDRES